jgi:hypothetical protein
MRRIASFYRLLIALSIIALVALSVFSLPSPYYEKLRYWVVYSQNPPARFEARMYVTYQFHTLNKPSGLLALNLRQGGFHLFISDSGNHVIRMFGASSGSLTTVAGTLGVPGYTDGAPLSARFNYPTGLDGINQWWRECDPPDNEHTKGFCWYNDYQTLHVNDEQNYVMRLVVIGDVPSTMSESVTTAAGNHTKGYVDGSCASASFAGLGGHMDSGGSCYLVDAANNCIRSVSAGIVNTFAGGAYPGFVDGYRTSARFNIPGKTTIDSAGNMYVADIGNNAIRKIDTYGYVSTSAGAGPEQIGLVDGNGSAAKFSRPTSVLFNATNGMLYVADSHNNCIRQVDSAGNVTTYAGTGTAGLVNGDRSQAQFSMPTDLVIFGSFMYVSDSLNNCIRRIDMTNGQVSTYIS